MLKTPKPPNRQCTRFAALRGDRGLFLRWCGLVGGVVVLSSLTGKLCVIPCGELWSVELNLQKKKKQHFVWRKYLRAWSENESIYCLMDGRIFKSGLMGSVKKDTSTS